MNKQDHGVIRWLSRLGEEHRGWSKGAMMDSTPPNIKIATKICNLFFLNVTGNFVIKQLLIRSKQKQVRNDTFNINLQEKSAQNITQKQPNQIHEFNEEMYLRCLYAFSSFRRIWITFNKIYQLPQPTSLQCPYEFKNGGQRGYISIAC